jgi:putative two-component system response regulator
MDRTALLIVDDEQQITNSLKRELKSEKYDIFTANSAKDGLELLKTQDVRVLLSDWIMPGMDGITFLGLVSNQYPEIVRILLTDQGNLKDAWGSINYSQIFGYLIKPWNPAELKGIISKAFEHYNLALENKRLQRLTLEQEEAITQITSELENRVSERTRPLQEAIKEGIIMLATAAEAKDDKTGNHVYRIRELTMKICKAMNLPLRQTNDISFFSMMHDVGKLHIPDSILLKPGPLTADEFDIMATHTVLGEKILGNKPFYKTAREIARSHHEHWDGTGYPDRLRGESIPLPARIVAIADVFDALTHDRYHKKAWALTTAINDMRLLSGRQFDPEALDAFLSIQGEDESTS